MTNPLENSCGIFDTKYTDTFTYSVRKSNYVNPPYNDLEPWIKKAIAERELGNTSVMLLPVRTSTRYFHNLILPNYTELRFLNGKLKFKGYKKGAPFDNYLVIFSKSNKRKHEDYSPSSSAPCHDFDSLCSPKRGCNRSDSPEHSNSE
jgi:hypothetical protein